MNVFFLPHILNVPLQTASPFDMVFIFPSHLHYFENFRGYIVFFIFWGKLHQLFDFGLGGINFEINLTKLYT
jgi:hypothetical protein